MKNELVAIRTLVGAILGLLIAFGLKISTAQNAAVLGVVDALIQALPGITALLGALSARSKTTGPETTAQAVRLLKLGNATAALSLLSPKKPRPSRGVARLGLVMCLCLATVMSSAVALVACSPGAWIVPVTAGLNAAGSFLSYVADFVTQLKKSQAATLVPADWWPKYDDAMTRARAAHALMNQALSQGEAAEADFWKHLEEFKAIGREIFGLFEGLGMLQRHGPDAGKLRMPPGTSSLRADGTFEPLPAPVNLQLPASK